MVNCQDLCVRQAKEMLFQALAVCGPIPAFAPHRRPDDQRHLDLAVIHVAKLGGVIDELVRGQGKKVAEHNLAHGPQPSQREAVAKTDNGRLADRGIEDAPRKLRAEIPGDFERATVRAFDVLADEHNPLIALHITAKRVVDAAHHPLARRQIGPAPLRKLNNRACRRFWQRRGERGCPGCFDRGSDAPLSGPLHRCAVGGMSFQEHRDGITLPMLLHVLWITGVVALGVGHETVGIHPQKAGTACAPDLLNGLEGFVQQVLGLPRVRCECGDAKGRWSRQNLAGQRLLLECALGVKIVL